MSMHFANYSWISTNFGLVSAMNYAAGLGRRPIVGLLVARGCALEGLNLYGVTPLEMAFACG